MQPLIIFGIGPHAQEMVEIVEQVNRAAPTWRLLGFMVPEAQAQHIGQTFSGIPVLGAHSDADRYSDAMFVPEFSACPPGFPRERLTSLIAPSAFVSATARIGRGCVIYPNCFVGFNAVIGDCGFIISGSVINHDDYLEDNVSLASNVSIAGRVHIEGGCYLGQASTVRQKLHIGKGSLIGMGSVVIQDVPPNSVMVGNPARRLRDRYPSHDQGVAR